MVNIGSVIGRNREDLEKFGTKGAGFIGRHLVIREYDWVLTTKVYFDLLRPHVMLISGKRGTGKSYASGVIIETFCMLPEDIRNKMAFVVFDPIGIYWSMKYPNEQQMELLKDWNLEPSGFADKIKLYVPEKQIEVYKKAGLPVDGGISISLREFSADDWILAFGWERTDEMALTLEKNLNELIKTEKDFDIEDLVEKIRNDVESKEEVKKALISILKVIDEWGVFSKKGKRIDDIIEPGKVIIIDTSRVKETAVQNMLAAKITREIYFNRVLARKEEEMAKIEGRKPRYTFPLTWIVFEEAHNYVPSDKKTVSTEPILTIAKQGREPGVSLVVITQMPNKIHSDVLAQTDIVLTLRLTAKSDLDALHSIMQTYMESDLEEYMNKLPRIPGAAIVLDDNQERIFSMVVRPRVSWHAGGTALVNI